MAVKFLLALQSKISDHFSHYIVLTNLLIHLSFPAISQSLSSDQIKNGVVTSNKLPQHWSLNAYSIFFTHLSPHVLL
jgi:ABC-type maltose transport system permease subunit